MQKNRSSFIRKTTAMLLSVLLTGTMTAYASPMPGSGPGVVGNAPMPPVFSQATQATQAYNQYPDMVYEQPQENLYLGGATLMLLAPATQSQNLSCILKTKNGSLIVIDGGLKEDAPHLTETIQANGGRVAAWLVTHPHSDHIGALTEILNQNPMPVQIDHVYYNFLERETYQNGEHMGRMADYDNLVMALNNLPAERKHASLSKNQKIQVDEVTINVLNLPFRSLYNTFNNSSVAYRLDVNGKRILFLGDMGWDAGQNLLSKCDPADLKADVVQMAHHGQDGVEEGVYRVIRPEICLWPTPDWLWDNVKSGQIGAGPWKTLTVRSWMEDLGVQRNLVIKDGDQILQ